MLHHCIFPLEGTNQWVTIVRYIYTKTQKSRKFHSSFHLNGSICSEVLDEDMARRLRESNPEVRRLAVKHITVGTLLREVSLPGGTSWELGIPYGSPIFC